MKTYINPQTSAQVMSGTLMQAANVSANNSLIFVVNPDPTSQSDAL